MVGEREAKRYVYCSGPLFCPEEVAAMAEIAGALEEKGFGTFLPQRDGVEAFVMNSVNSRLASSFFLRPITRFVNKAVFAVDIYQIVERCDCLVFNMNGRVPDEGGLVETAVAFACGKPVVIYRSDIRSTLGGYDNPMLHGVSRAFPVAYETGCIPDLVAGVIEDLKQCPRAEYSGDNVPPRVRRVVDFGRRVCGVLAIIQPLKPGNTLIE